MPNSVIPEFNLPPTCQLPIGIQGDLGMAEVEVVGAVNPNQLKPAILQNL